MQAELDGILTESASEVLETMFFSAVLADAEQEVAAGSGVTARLSFRGDSSGSFGVWAKDETGRRLAASFHGTDEESVTSLQVEEVLCELANMLCGTMLSRVKRNSRFSLSHPQAETVSGRWDGPVAAAYHVWDTDCGELAAWLEWREA